MHIALWSPAWPLEKHQNGVVTYVHAMRLGLEARGHRVTVFTGRCDGGDAIPVKSRVGNVFDFSRAISKAILREHRRSPIDVIEMEEAFGWCADVQAATGLPMVVKLHGPAFLAPMDPGHNAERMEREGEALRHCRTIISPSADTLARTIRQYQLVNANTRVVVNPIVVDPRVPVWDVENCDRRAILYVGRFDIRKGADVILKAMGTVWKTRPDATMTFVGPEGALPSPQSGLALGFWNYCATLYRPAQRDQIICLGPRPHNELAALRASAAVTVVASRWESYGYTLLEAMGQGCPVVSTDAGACPEAIEHGKTGLLARSEDPEDFGAKISAILSDPIGAARMGAAARAHVTARYSVDQAVDSMLACYEKVRRFQAA